MISSSSLIQDHLEHGVLSNTFPQAELLVAKQGQIVFHSQTKSYKNETPFFDLASLTKALCTSLVCLFLESKKQFDSNALVSDFFSTDNLNNTPITTLLNHTSGLIDWIAFYSAVIFDETHNYKRNHQNILQLILNDNNMKAGSQKVIYSDLGYILLGHLIEKTLGEDLSAAFNKLIATPLGIQNEIFFSPLPFKFDAKKFIPSEFCPLRKKMMQGEVMDRNSWVQGGVTGHAGLFATASSIHFILIELRKALANQSDLFKTEVAKKYLIPDAHRDWNKPCFTLGFDTPTFGKSQSGRFFSKNSIGHLGYAGTSFWWDLDHDFWIILLTNRCMPDRKNFRIQKYRPALHDTVVQELGLT